MNNIATLSDIRARFNAESQSGASRAIRALAAYGLALVNLLEIRAGVNLWQVETEQPLPDPEPLLVAEMNRVFNLIMQEIRNGYPTTEAELVNHLVFKPTDQE